MSSPGSVPLQPEFLSAAADPIRWRLLSALSGRDARVSELCEHLQLRQNLVSYHLGRLRAGGLVQRRRSTSDGRDGYYVLDLERCAEMLGHVASALHPALAVVAPVDGALNPNPNGAPVAILFVCTGNSARSRMAEALANTLGGGQIQARSAGSHPKPLHRNAERVLMERGIGEIADESTWLESLQDQHFDHVITLCDRVREICPEFPGHPAARHWSIPDPAGPGSTDADTYPAFIETRDEIERRVRFFIAEVALATKRPAA